MHFSLDILVICSSIVVMLGAVGKRLLRIWSVLRNIVAYDPRLVCFVPGTHISVFDLLPRMYCQNNR